MENEITLIFSVFCAKIDNNFGITKYFSVNFNFQSFTSDFYEAFQHFFRGFPKSVRRLRSKKYIGLRERL
jgi:hypothetical protein